jgi:hypothetical protein
MKTFNRTISADDNQKGNPRTNAQPKDSTANGHERTRIKSPLIRVDSCAFAVEGFRWCQIPAGLNSTVPIPEAEGRSARREFRALGWLRLPGYLQYPWRDGQPNLERRPATFYN